MHEQIDIGIITVISTEIQAIKQVLNLSGDSEKSEYGNIVYLKGSFFSDIAGRNVTVVVSFLNEEAGNTEAAITTKHFLNDWYPRIMCLVGIAAGIKGTVKIGDVVIPSKIHDRSIKTFKEGKFKPRNKSISRHDIINSTLKISPLTNDMFRKAYFDEMHLQIYKALSIAKSMNIPLKDFDENFSILDGSLLSDNTLIRDNKYFYNILNILDDKCRGGDMESSGFVRACSVQRSELPWMIFRGISDFGDSIKSDDFQLIAAKCAVIAFRETFRHCIDIDKLDNDPRVEKYHPEMQHDIFNQVEEAYIAQRWDEVCRIGEVISRYLWTSGQYRERIEIGKMVITAASHIKDKKIISSFLVDDVGWTQYVKGNEVEKTNALANIRKGLAIANVIGDHFISAKAHRHLASISRTSGKYDDAEIEIKKAEGEALQITDPIKKNEIDISLLFSLAKLHGERNIEDSLWLDEAMRVKDLYLIHKDKKRVVKVYSFIGKMYYKKECFDKAIDFYQKGLALAYEVKRYDEIKRITEDLSELKRRM